MKWLQDILNENGIEDTEEIVGIFKEEFPKHAVPKDEYNKKAEKIDSLVAQLEQYEEQIEQTSNQLEKLEEYSEENEELQHELEQIREEKERFEEEKEQRIQEIQKKNELEKGLLKSNVNEDAVDLLINDFQLDELEINDDGELAGFDDQLKKVQEKRPTLFGEKQVKGDEPKDGDAEDTVINIDDLDDKSEEYINKNWDKISKQLSKKK